MADIADGLVTPDFLFNVKILKKYRKFCSNCFYGRGFLNDKIEKKACEFSVGNYF